MKHPFLSVIFILQVFFSVAQNSTVNFTAYNCSLTSFDTTLTVTPGDTLNFVSLANGSTNLFYSVNNEVIDTVSVSTGNLIQQHIVSPNDTVVQFLVWTNPGSCYGQRFHLSQPAALGEKANEEIQLIYIQQNNELIIQNTNFDELTIYDLNGNSVAHFSLERNAQNTLILSHKQQGIHFIVLQNNQGTRIKKLFI